MSVSSFRICLSLDEVQRSLHVTPQSPFDAVHVKPHLFICRTTRKIHRTRHKEKVINKTDIKYHSFEV